MGTDKDRIRFISTGDVVIKSSGHMSVNQIGLVIEVYENSVGNSFVTVLTSKGRETWFANLVENVTCKKDRSVV